MSRFFKVQGAASCLARVTVLGSLCASREFKRHAHVRKHRTFWGGREDWPSYVERLRAFFVANDVPDGKKQAIFFICCGLETYSLLRDLAKPAKPQDKSLDEVLCILGNHYCPKPSAVVQRFRFNSPIRAGGESVNNFVAALESLSEHCNFGTEFGNMLRDRIVCGINSTAIKASLLEQADLTFEHAVQTVLAMEAAKTDAGGDLPGQLY